MWKELHHMAAYRVCFPLFKISAFDSNPKGVLGNLWFGVLETSDF